MVACLLALLWALVIAAPAYAAPQYEDSEPGDGSSVQTAPASVSVTFNEPLDDSSTLTIENECGARVDGGATFVELNEMRMDLTEGHYSGTYTIGYKAVGVGGVTGTNEGSISFDVAEGHSCDDGGNNNHNHGNGNKNGNNHNHGNEHDNHGNDDDHGDHGDDHGSMDHDDHSTMDHDTHSTMGSSHSHTSGTDHSSMEHGSGNGEHPHGGEGHDNPGGSVKGSFASGPLPELPPDGRTVLLALLLCAGMGVVGGVFLRNAG